MDMRTLRYAAPGCDSLQNVAFHDGHLLEVASEDSCGQQSAYPGTYDDRVLAALRCAAFTSHRISPKLPRASLVREAVFRMS